MAGPNLRSISPGRERIEPLLRVPRHRHREAYALITLEGSFEQVSYAGRVTTGPGHLIVQPTLDCHLNCSSKRGAEILRLPWRRVEHLGGIYLLDDLDAVIRLAERDPGEAARFAAHDFEGKKAVPPKSESWCDALAVDLARGNVKSITTWAEERGLCLDTLIRSFRRLYGITPARFRLELKTRSAWLAVTQRRQGLAHIAAECGFADQSHMTRAIRRLTGASPGFWRSDSAEAASSP